MKHSVDFSNLFNLPCHVFWKDSAGVYQGYNNFGATNLGYKNHTEIIGKTDLELFPEDVAHLYRENDRQVRTHEKQLFFSEQGMLKNNSPTIFMSYKMPIYDEHRLIVGVLGIAFTRNEMDLSDRENLCLHYLAQGLTLKMIAREMHISPKTVETYLERVKKKMNCYNKTQLISLYLNRAFSPPS